jgi:DNA-binding CsgD family transcriptional regulator
VVEILGRQVFVGRERELARLLGLLATARDGSGRAVIVGGEAGIGKSALVDRFARRVTADGALVLEGACLPLATDELPYRPFVELLRRLFRQTPPERLPALLGPARAELPRLLPELRDVVGRDRGPAIEPAATPEPERHGQARLFELIVGVLERLASRSAVVVVVEDVQWADRPSQDLLGYLVRALRQEPVLIVITLRTDATQPDAGLASFLAELEREAEVERLDLETFARPDVEAQLRALLDDAVDDELVDRVLRRSDGNPFFVEELVLAGSLPGRAELPPVVGDVVAARIAGLSSATRDVLRVAAVAGRRLDDDLLAAVLAIDPRDLAGALRDALEAGVVVRTTAPGDEGLAFRHELVREVVDREVFPAERAALHLAFAQGLEKRRGQGRAVAPGALASHWDQAGRPDRALAPLVEAARAAESVYAFADAVERWRRARELIALAPGVARQLGIDPGTALERAAEAAVLAGQYERAVALGREALASVDADAEPARAGHLLERLRWFLWEAGDRAGARAAVDAALSLIPEDPPSAARARALGQRAGIELMTREYQASHAHAAEALALARAVGSASEAAFALGILAWTEAVLGDVDGGIARLRDAVEVSRRLGSVEGTALGTLGLAALLDRVGRPGDALTAALDGHALAERLGLARTYGSRLLGVAARAALTLGRVGEADDLTQRGLALRPGGVEEIWLLINRGRVLAYLDRQVEAREALARGRRLDDARGGTEFRTALLMAEAERAALAGSPSDGRLAVDEGLAMESPAGPPDPDLAWLAATGLRLEADLAEAGRAVRDAARVAEAGMRASRILEAVEAAAGGLAAFGASQGTRLAAMRGLLAAEGARVEERDPAGDWAANAAAWEALGRPLVAAYARYRAAAAVLRDHGDRATVIEHLRAAHDTAATLGAAAIRKPTADLARRARIELDETGVDRKGGGFATFGFTEREREVLDLVAAGWSNQQIADRLFITRKTASVHVSNILGKLGVNTRTEAAALAHRLGLGGEAPPPPS